MRVGMVVSAATATEIEDAGGSANFLHHDVTSEDEWVAVVAGVFACVISLFFLVPSKMELLKRHLIDGDEVEAILRRQLRQPRPPVRSDWR